MKLNELFQNAPEVEIKNLMPSSKLKRADSIFFCIKGMKFDGHRFIDEAIENGAKVVVHSDDIEYKNPDIIYIKVSDVSKTFSLVADAFYSKPSSKLIMFGVTGTNGKSSIASLIKRFVDMFYPCGYIGTIAVEYGDVKLESDLTTPSADDLHGILRDMVNAGMKACSLEVSSIGIEQDRVSSIDFDVAIFTNLTHDHLDFHGTMRNYFEAKKKFFDSMKTDGIVITNVDDPYGLDIVKDTCARIYTYGINNNADFMAKNVRLLSNKTIFDFICFDKTFHIETNLVALFNVYNLISTLSALYLKGIDIEKIIPHLANIYQIEGRMEKIDEGQKFNIVVDFAHTPDGLKQVFEFASAITPKENRIISIFGSAGRRDTKKRRVFGELADKYCDLIILTEDDPRDENITDIALEISEGIKDTNYIIIEDRKEAINQAIEVASDLDTILILGKGDQDYMYREFGKERYDGDDKIARLAVRKRLKSYEVK